MVVVIITAFSVFEPFVGDLIAADVELPDGFGDVIKVLGFVDIDFVLFIGESMYRTKIS